MDKHKDVNCERCKKEIGDDDGVIPCFGRYAGKLIHDSCSLELRKSTIYRLGQSIDCWRDKFLFSLIFIYWAFKPPKKKEKYK